MVGRQQDADSWAEAASETQRSKRLMTNRRAETVRNLRAGDSATRDESGPRGVGRLYSGTTRTLSQICTVRPLGTLKDDPNVTDKKCPGNPTRSYRTREPVEVAGELLNWVGHPPERLQVMRDGLAHLKRLGLAVIYD